MIHPDTLKIEWIRQVAQANRKADKILVEKAIRALYLLEQLRQSDLDFIFKGGTALILLLSEPKRFSIDLDIIVPKKPGNIKTILNKIIEQSDFLEYREDERKAKSLIDKAHFKFYYKPVTSARTSQEYILLDILFEESPYGKGIKNTEVKSAFLKTTAPSVKVAIPDFESILGDKLTAFAPNTTGVRYGVNKEIEIVKQLYDIGILFDRIDNVSPVREVFNRIAKTELGYRGKPEQSSAVVLEDIFQTSLCIATRGQEGKGNFNELQKGIQNIKNFIFSEPFHLEKAMVPAAKAAYLSELLKTPSGRIQKFKSPAEIAKWMIEKPFITRLNKFKKSNPEAFFYWFHTAHLLR